jgi:putative protein-disulfide isomerase
MTPLQLLYFANPMCSWCWGFAPVIQRLVAEHGEAIDVGVALGALGDRSKPMDEAAKVTIRGHWKHVAALTAQPFEQAFFAREGFVYDTVPACAAVMVVRSAPQHPNARSPSSTICRQPSTLATAMSVIRRSLGGSQKRTG